MAGMTSSKFQQQMSQLPFTMHQLSQDPSKRVQIVNFEQQEFTYNFTPKLTITYSSYETPSKNSENSSANDDSKMNMAPNENTFQGLSNGSKPNLQSDAVMEKSVKLLQNHLCNVILKAIETLIIHAKVNHRFHFFPRPFQLIRRLLRMEDIALLKAMTQHGALML